MTLVHAGLFTHAGNSSARAILGIAPFNLVSAGLVLAAGFVTPPWDWPLWGLAVLVVVSSSLFGRERGFALSPAHFVERHGLVVIVALGESVVAIGVGARGLPLSPGVILSAVLGLALAAGLWWTYFDRDDRRAEHRIGALNGPARARAALNAFGYGHFLMLGGVVVLAAGIKGWSRIPGATPASPTPGTWAGAWPSTSSGTCCTAACWASGPGAAARRRRPGRARRAAGTGGGRAGATGGVRGIARGPAAGRGPHPPGGR